MLTPVETSIDSNLDEWLLDFNAKITDEDPVRTERELDTLKRLVSEISGCKVLLEDKYLMKFLRAANFDSQKAFRMIDTIHQWRLASPGHYLPEGKGPLDYEHVYKLRCVEVLRHRNPRDGSAIVIVSAGDWNPKTGVDFLESQNAGCFVADIVLDDERVQRDGVTLIIDSKGICFSWLIHFFPPSCIQSVVYNLQDTCPIRFVGVHIINESRLSKLLYNIASPFISNENKEKIHFHGPNIEMLQKFIPREVLPRRYFGAQPSDFNWIPELAYEKHDFYVARSVLPKPPSRRSSIK